MDISSRIELKDYIVTDDDDIFVFPASPIQKQIWDLNKLYPDSSVFNKIYGFRIKGKFNYDAYSWALNKIIERHESLRTCFGYRENSLVQIIKTSMTIDNPLFNLSDDERDKKETKIKQIIETELSNPFNLKTGPLIRSVVVKLAEGEFELFLSTHSIIADQTSLIIFNKELGLYYSRYSAGKYTDVESPRLQYADWVMFNFTEEQQKSHTGKLEYWKNQLNGFQEALDLNYDNKKPVRRSLRGDVYNFEISKRTSEKIKSIIRKESKIACPFFLSVLNILLYRYSGKQELIVGCPFSNRIYPGTEDIIGCMANTLPVKTVLKEDDTFNSLLKNVKENVQSAKKNQEVPFEKIMESLGSDFNPGNSPIYQVNFIYGNSAIVPEFEDLQIESLHLHNLSSQYDISLHIWENDEVFSGYIEYATDLFEKATVARMFSHYVNIIETGLENPDVRINDINILTQEELKLYAQLNETSVNFPSEKCIHSLFEEQAFRTPDAIALQYERQKLTYVQLNEQANCFANFLIKKGVNVGDFVGVNIERCLEIPVVLLGILKAGAAYIPLDPGFPTERLNYMVEDAKIKYLVTTSSNKEIFKSGNQIEYILLDKEISNIYKHYDNHNISKKYSSENLAYILFTSGSTGKPKGVKIQHKAFVNFINSMAKTPGVNRNDILLSVTTLSFDIAGLEIFLPLLNGARTVILPKDVVMDAELLAESISKYSATIMQATPVTWKLLLEFGWQPKSLLKILCGGEALSSTLAGKLSKLNCELWNMYGPTETCVWSSVKKILPDDAFVSIGRPIDNTTFYILDKYLNMVPVGIPGELYIGGMGLSSGYLNRPELTDTMFIKNPFSSEPDSRIYKTGDLAKSHPDGNVECLGRVDYQVKIRGFRVEIGEIEKQLVKINNIKEAVVVSVSEDCGLNQLVAYIITDDGNIDISGIRKNLNEFLPDYMIPSTFNLISSFPLTPNGKID